MANGFCLINKPKGITSFDVVAKVRKSLNTKKVGHAGTLDPMATGLMLVGVGQGTKLLTYMVGLDKQYLATIRLGLSTVTDDAEGEPLEAADASHLTPELIDAEIAKLNGEIDQVPSSVSAKKIDGKRAYDLVREGQEVELKPKRVMVSRFERTSELRFSQGFCDVDVIVDCSSGTFIRALARDMGKALGVGGHLTALQRTKVGNYRIEHAQELSGDLDLTGLAEVAANLMPVREITSQEVTDVRHGKPLQLNGESGQVALVNEGLVAISSPRDGKLRSEVVFSEDAND